MGQVSSVLRRATNGYVHWCPACEEMHALTDTWKFDGNLECPTFTPSFKHEGLMRFKIDVTENANIAAGAVVTLKFQDGTTDIGIAQDAFLPTTQITTQLGDGFSSGWIDLGNGYLSSAANNVLNINLSTALSNGNVRVLVCGTEE